MQTELSNFWKTIERSKNPLICFREDLESSSSPLGGDAIASALALKMVLEKVGKSVEILSTGFRAMPHFEFLGANTYIKNGVEALRKFVISIDISKNKVNDFSYNINGEKLDIYLTPKQGTFDDKTLETRHENFKYDAIITLDTPSLGRLGKLYSTSPELFYNIPIINIDHDPSNEFYGQINIVNLSAGSTAEMVSEIIKHNNIQVDGDLATKLLAGLIAKTKSFRNPNLSPKTLQLASRLVELGARRDEIINNFYRTRSVETLKLWGRALAKLKSSPEHKLVWALLSREDFINSGASTDAELSDVINELIVYSPQADVITLLYEQSPLNIFVVIACMHGRDTRELGKIFAGEGTREMVKFSLTSLNLVEAEKEVITKLKQAIH